jgi:hypothetical protein
MIAPASASAVLRFPIVCPTCGCETLITASARAIAEALNAGTQIVLRAGCCATFERFASELEIEQIREYADIHNLASSGRSPTSPST